MLCSMWHQIQLVWRTVPWFHLIDGCSWELDKIWEAKVVLKPINPYSIQYRSCFATFSAELRAKSSFVTGLIVSIYLCTLVRSVPVFQLLTKNKNKMIIASTSHMFPGLTELRAKPNYAASWNASWCMCTLVHSACRSCIDFAANTIKYLFQNICLDNLQYALYPIIAMSLKITWLKSFIAYCIQLLLTVA